MKIALEKFSGMIPRRNPRLLPTTASELAENTKLWSGKLKPWLGNLAVCDPFQTLPRSIYLFGKNAIPPGFWFQFSESEVDVIKGQVGGDETERTYFTGGPQGRPQVTDKFIGIRGEEETWSADEHYTIGNIVVGTSTSGVYFECTTAGTASTTTLVRSWSWKMRSSSQMARHGVFCWRIHAAWQLRRNTHRIVAQICSGAFPSRRS